MTDDTASRASRLRLNVFAFGPMAGTICYGTFHTIDDALATLSELDIAFTAAEIIDLETAPWHPALRICWRERTAWISIDPRGPVAPL